MNLTNTPALTRTNVTGIWYRAVVPGLLTQAIARPPAGKRPGGRFSMDGADPAGFDVLYLGQDHDTILREVGAVFGPLLNPISNPDAFKSWVVLPITVNLTDVVDLTDPVQAHLLSTNAQELTGDFRHFGIRTPPASGPAPHTGRAPTQELSLELHRLGFKGIINFSAKRPDRRTLAVFHDHLAAPCFIEYRCEVSYGKFQTVRIP